MSTAVAPHSSFGWRGLWAHFVSRRQRSSAVLQSGARIEDMRNWLDWAENQGCSAERRQSLAEQQYGRLSAR